jgi:signal recognition particle receptor subunit beta
MVQINFAQKQVNAKIVYYGPGMSGKTTNLEVVYQRAPQPNRGELTSISTDGDRTLFFDFMPLDLGTVSGMRTCFQIYTVPGQVYYNSTRKLVLQGVDGVVFVADSSASMVEENLESMRNLEQNLNEYGKSLASIPLIIQYNKRDLPDAMSVDELNRLLNPYNAPCFEAIANTGQGVFPTLKALAARVLDTIHTGSGAKAAPQPAQPSISTGTTGFYVAPARPGQAAPAQPAAAQPQPAALAASAGAPATRPLHQTGYHAVKAPQPAQAQAPRAQPAIAAHLQPFTTTSGGAGGQTAFVPQGLASPQPIQPAQAQAPSLRMAGADAPIATAAHPSTQNGSARQLKRPDPPAPSPAAARKPAPAAAQPASRQQREPAGRIQPRSAPRPTPAPSKRNLMYTVVLVVAALCVGAVLAKAFLSFS